LKRLAEKARRIKPGRWVVHRDGLGPEFVPDPQQNFGVDDSKGCVVVWHGVARLGGIPHEEVATYIAAANPAAILELIAENERLRNAIAGLLEWVAPIAGDNQDDEASQRELDSVRVAEAAMQEAAK